MKDIGALSPVDAADFFKAAATLTGKEISSAAFVQNRELPERPIRRIEKWEIPSLECLGRDRLGPQAHRAGCKS